MALESVTAVTAMIAITATLLHVFKTVEAPAARAL
jgi:hypothetical protein